jgi:hypothetical protein
MPGTTLTLSCPCGFRSRDVCVGVTDSHCASTFALCPECRKIVPLHSKHGGEFSTRCHQCGMKLKALDEPGAWEPAELQRRFPGTEPWLVENQICELQEKEAEYYYSMYENIRILCPKCGKYSLTYKVVTLWD